MPALFSFFLWSGSSFAQHTYYISKSTGSDSNSAAQAQSKSTPWAHLPGMPACSANCGSYKPVAGDRFILKGGDTWAASDLGINWQWSGTSGNNIYIGVDKTWFAGTAWNRPKFDCGGTGACASNQFGNLIWLAGNYTTFDNIEITGWHIGGDGGNIIATYGNNNEVSNNYIHNFSRVSGTFTSTPYAISNNMSGGGGLGTNVHDNVIDGEDSPNQDFMGGILHGIIVRNNVIRYVYNGMNGGFDVIDGNLVEFNYLSVSGDHCNMVFPQDTASSNTLVVSNNVIRHARCGGGSTLFTMGNSSCTSCTAYVFNNVMYDNAADFDPGITIGSHGATGTYYVWNNTVESGGRECMGNGESPPRSTAHFANNQCINSSMFCNGTGTNCVNDGGNLLETAAQANLAGFLSTATYPYAPVSASSPTVNTGVNLTSSCSGSAAALCKDTSAPSYDTVSHSPVIRAAVSRPASGPWDSGAYRFTPSGCSITPASAGPYTAGQQVSQQFSASGCNTGTFKISSGSLGGSGLALNSSGLLSGAAQAGSFSFVVAYDTATTPIQLQVNPAPTIVTASLSAGQVNTPYSQVLNTTGGTGAATCTVASGTLPAGLSLSGCTISGTPSTANTYSFSIAVTDANGVTGTAIALSIVVVLPDTSAPVILHATFCGPAASWPGTCTLSAPTTAGSRLVVVYSSYNSAGSTPTMTAITDGGDTFQPLPNTRSVNTAAGNSSWNEMWTSPQVAAGRTALTITTSTTQTGNVYVWEVQNANQVAGCASLSSQAAANPAVGVSIPVSAKMLLLMHLHPAPGGFPTAVAAPFVSDTITDQMAYAHYTTGASGTFAPQWSQTAATFATGGCAFSSSATLSRPGAPTGLTVTAH